MTNDCFYVKRVKKKSYILAQIGTATPQQAMEKLWREE